MIFTGDKNDNQDFEFQDVFAHLELISKVRNASLRIGWFVSWKCSVVAVRVWVFRGGQWFEAWLSFCFLRQETLLLHIIFLYPDM